MNGLLSGRSGPTLYLTNARAEMGLPKKIDTYFYTIPQNRKTIKIEKPLISQWFF